MHFTKLRLAGFKSFVDPTELPIEPGVTGIVGPNGCGKSNLVEALRWVMGENSARRVRGSEMDDVIFAGGGGRPARNLAEVLLVADNSARTAPANFNVHDQLEISRHIERGAGSTYRVNGKAARARDIQILFQDHQTGSTSPAMVGQGQIGAIVTAKPADRRRLLEEAAGVSGLHGRRHEAELRLNAAETNLRRLEDIMTTMVEQLANLKKQARQAARYRSLSDRIRKGEALLYTVRWHTASSTLNEAESARDAAERDVAERLATAASARNTAEKADEALPPLRQAEAEAAAKLQRLTIAREQLDAEEERLATARKQAEDRLAQLQADGGRERELAGEAEQAIKRLAEEAEQARKDAAGEEEAQNLARAQVKDARAELEQAEQRLDELVSELAAGKAQRQSLESRRENLERRSQEANQRIAVLETKNTELGAAWADEKPLADAEQAMQTAQASLTEAREAAEAAQESAEVHETALETARTAKQIATDQRAAFQAEIDALVDVLDESDAEQFPPLIDSVTVKPGYELAFAAAMGEDAMVPLDEAAPVHWSTLPPLDDAQALPDGITRLMDYVKAPPALARRLAHVGLVEDSAKAESLIARLLPGQQIVSKDGGHWRWDGLVVTAGGETAAGKRLRQRNRLEELRPLSKSADAAAEEAASVVERCETALAEARTEAQTARDRVSGALDKLEGTRRDLSRLEKQRAEQDSTRQRLISQLEEAQAAQAEADDELRAVQAEIADLPDLETLGVTVQTSQAERAERRSVSDSAMARLDGLIREADSRAQKIANIERESTDWQQRAERATERVAELRDRATEEQNSLESLASDPEEQAKARRALQEQLDEATLARKLAGDKLAEAETAAREANEALREAEGLAVEARETRATAAGQVETAAESLAQLRDRMAEKLNCRPLELRDIAGLKPDADLPEEEAASNRVNRLYHERETMGAVNLRAEEEATEAEERIESLENEKTDVEAAIGELRRGIANLNKEARERLVACFDQVDEHFRTLFTRLFGGGKAYLKLTDPNDPLNAGLEIFASPPGKRLQNLSLLSGGERALTALALLFAVFLTNPAPICVLDEVDAPLDDANVERFCKLVEDLVEKAGTRFLIVTHHRMTMARVDRLVGVTMTEAGVSQMVTVDLEQALALRDSA